MNPKKLLFYRAIGAVLFIASALAVIKLRPHDISSSELISHHELLGLNAWQLRWKFGWESSREYPVISGIPTPALTWKIENGGVLTVGLAADDSGCVVFKAVIPQGQGKDDLIIKDTVTERIAKIKAETPPAPAPAPAK
jgi:hypothetical protein